MEATIKTLATIDDIANVKYELSKDISVTIKWMFNFLDWPGSGNVSFSSFICEKVKRIT